MSNTYKKTPVFGNTLAPSEKQDKRLANRRLRRINKVELMIGDELSDLRETSSAWSFAKDGKKYRGDKNYPEYLRK
tara:strand:+ start:270 stop:497 length:228 start_codon:yes stop_codon:yes gene_type:complete